MTRDRYTAERRAGTWHLFSRLPRRLKRPVERAAKAEGLPLNKWLETRLTEWLDEASDWNRS